MYDLIIIGAGPAGATLARLLGDRYKILVLDRRELLAPGRGPVEKSCGGLIAPDAQYMLAKMGLGVPREVLVGPQLFTVRTIDVQNKLERYYQRNYININRDKFDGWLVSLIPAAVDIRCGTLFKAFETKEDGIVVNFQTEGRQYAERAKFLVGADGAGSLIRRRLTGKTFQQTYISVQEWFEANFVQPYFSAIFDSDVSDFYSWTIPKDDYLIVGTAIAAPKEQVLRRFDLLKQRLTGFGYDLGSSVKRNGAFVLRPRNASQIYLGQGNTGLIGEAAGWISPTSAEGLSYAFRSAIALAQSFTSDPPDVIREYQRHTVDLRLNIMTKNLKAPFMYNPLLRKAVLRLGLSSMEIDKDNWEGN